MREIKFRACGVITGEWLYSSGFYYDGENYWFITPSTEYSHAIKFSDQLMVDGDTIGQYTGLKDRNGKGIYEGDIVAYDEDFNHSGVIQFSCGIFGINWDYSKNTDPEWKQGRMYGGWGNKHNLRKISDGFNQEIIIIGNIHENPELLA